MSAQNKYIVTWDIYANTETAVSNIRAFTSSVQTQNKALRTGITNLKEYNAQLLALRNNMRKVGGVMSSTGRQAVGQGAGVFPNTKAAKGYAGWNSMMMPPFAPTPVLTNSRLNAMAKKQMAAQQKAATKATTQSAAKGAAIGGARGASRGAGFVSPLKGTPFGGLMGTLLAYSAISTNVVQAAEYDNLMTTAKSFLKVADNDLTTFEARFSRLAKNVREVGLSTKFTATQVAGATKYLAMAGMDIATIDKSIRPIADLALIGDEDLALIADLSTNIMTGYGLDEGAMTNVADIIASTMTRSNVSITEIAESFKMSAGYLASSGIDFSEATAAIGVLGDAGMKATLAGTALRAMMIRFAKPTKEAKKILDGFGVSFTETTNVMGEQVKKVRPLVDIFTELKEKGAGLEDLQRIFGTIGGNAAIQLISRTDKLQELAMKNRYSHGTSSELSWQKQNTTAGLWHQMISKFQDQFLIAFEQLTPSIGGTLRSITEALGSKEFVDGIVTLGQGLLGLVEIGSKIGIWMGTNWSWIQPLIISKFVYGNIMNLSRGITGLAGSLSGLAGSGAAASGVLSGVALGWVGLAAAVASGATAMYLSYSSTIENQNKIVENIKSTTPDVSLSINDWATAIGKFRTGIIDADGSIKDLKATLAEEKTVAKEIGFGDVSMFTWLNQTDETGKKQVDAYLGMQIKSAFDALVGAMIVADPTATNFDEQMDKLIGSALNPFAKNSSYVISSLYKYERGKRVGFDKRLSDLPVETLVHTHEFQAGWRGVMEGLMENIAAPYRSWLSSRQSASQAVKNMLGEDSVELLKTHGVIDSSGMFNKNLAGTKLDTKEGTATMHIIRELFQSLLKDTTVILPDGSKGKMPASLVAKAMDFAGVPSEFWGTTPLNTNSTNVDSGLSTDDDGVGGAGGSSKGLRGASNQPRQVIVNLDNLLNIESVEIDNTNQDIEIDNIKEKIAQALLDVVADYSASYHG